MCLSIELYLYHSLRQILILMSISIDKYLDEDRLPYINQNRPEHIEAVQSIEVNYNILNKFYAAISPGHC